MMIHYAIGATTGAVIGYVTNYLAIKMLFRPIKPVKFLGFSFQGVIPKEKELLAQKISEIVSQNIITNKDISKLLHQKHIRNEIRDFLRQKVDDIDIERLNLILEEKIKSYSFEKELKALETYKSDISQYLAKFFLELIEQKFGSFVTSIISQDMISNMIEENIISFAENITKNEVFKSKLAENVKIENFVDIDKQKEKIVEFFYFEIIKFLRNDFYKFFAKIDLSQVIYNKVKNFSEEKMEEILMHLMNKHLKFINFAGAVLGAIVGISQIFILQILK